MTLGVIHVFLHSVHVGESVYCVVNERESLLTNKHTGGATQCVMMMMRTLIT